MMHLAVQIVFVILFLENYTCKWSVGILALIAVSHLTIDVPMHMNYNHIYVTLRYP